MNQHYFSESPTGHARTREIEVELAGASRSLVTAGGVFSPEHLDRGTEVLLRALDGLPPLSHEGAQPTILDIGCGWGPIALDAALAQPESQVWAIDVNERARSLAVDNAKRLGLDNVRVSSPENVPAELRFTQIRSNPPIRIGKEALHEILLQWLPRLAPGGTAYLVVAKHLGADSLQKWIGATFSDLAVDRFARKKGFHVLRAAKPDASAS